MGKRFTTRENQPGKAAANQMAVPTIPISQTNPHHLTSLELRLVLPFITRLASPPLTTTTTSPPPLLHLAIDQSLTSHFLRSNRPGFNSSIFTAMESVEGNGGGRGNLQLLVSELCRVQELVRQLELHLQAPDTSVDMCRALSAQIVALTDRSIGFVAAHFPDAAPTPSTTSSPLSDVSDQPFRTNAKKRKATARWTSQVRVSAAGGAEGPGDDGHSWRKYGQKDILGAKHPRGYYRCTHRNSQGCAATKQVQRADEDHALFDVVYHGQHTCRPTAGRRPPPPNQHNPHAQSLLHSLSAGLTVDTDNGGLHGVVSPLTPENRPVVARGQSMASPVASDSNGGLAMSPYPVTAYTEWLSDGTLQEVVSAFTAVSAPAPAPTMDAEFMPYCLFDYDLTFNVEAQPSLFP